MPSRFASKTASRSGRRSPGSRARSERVSFSSRSLWNTGSLVTSSRKSSHWITPATSWRARTCRSAASGLRPRRRKRSSIGQRNWRRSTRPPVRSYCIGHRPDTTACTWAEFGNQVFRVVPCLSQQYERQRGLAIAVRPFGGRLILLGGCGYPAVELLHRDGSVRRVECREGVIFTALTPADASARLQAVNQDGSPVASSMDVGTLVATSRPGQARPSPRRRKQRVNKKEGA